MRENLPDKALACGAELLCRYDVRDVKCGGSGCHFEIRNCPGSQGQFTLLPSIAVPRHQCSISFQVDQQYSQMPLPTSNQGQRRAKRSCEHAGGVNSVFMKLIVVKPDQATPRFLLYKQRKSYLTFKFHTPSPSKEARTAHELYKCNVISQKSRRSFSSSPPSAPSPLFYPSHCSHLVKWVSGAPSDVDSAASSSGKKSTHPWTAASISTVSGSALAMPLDCVVWTLYH